MTHERALRAWTTLTANTSHARQFRHGFVSKWHGECTCRWHLLLSVQQGVTNVIIDFPIARADCLAGSQ